MIKISNKQRREIDFLQKYFSKNKLFTSNEIDQFILWTSKGEGGDSDSIKSRNSVFQAKRSLDITIKMWREDLGYNGREPIIAFYEIEMWHDSHPYIMKVINSMRRNIGRTNRYVTAKEIRLDYKPKQ